MADTLQDLLHVVRELVESEETGRPALIEQLEHTYLVHTQEAHRKRKQYLLQHWKGFDFSNFPLEAIEDANTALFRDRGRYLSSSMSRESLYLCPLCGIGVFWGKQCSYCGARKENHDVF
jgi:hypothetical protein